MARKKAEPAIPKPVVLPKRKRGRRGHKYGRAPEIMRAIVESVSRGNYKSTAVKAAGITYTTFGKWRQKHPEFDQAIKQAEGTAEIELIDIIKKAAAKHWTAAAWLLERHWSERWSVNSIPEDIGEEQDVGMEIVHPDGTVMSIDQTAADTTAPPGPPTKKA